RVDHEGALAAADHLLRLTGELVGPDDAGADDADVERPDRRHAGVGVAQPISSINRTVAPVRSSRVSARLIASTSAATARPPSRPAGDVTAARLTQSWLPEILTVMLGRRFSTPPPRMIMSPSLPGSLSVDRSSGLRS